MSHLKTHKKAILYIYMYMILTMKHTNGFINIERHCYKMNEFKNLFLAKILSKQAQALVIYVELAFKFDNVGYMHVHVQCVGNTHVYILSQ